MEFWRKSAKKARANCGRELRPGPGETGNGRSISAGQFAVAPLNPLNYYKLMILSDLLIPVQAGLILVFPGAVLAAAAARGKKAEFRDFGEFIFFAGLISMTFASVSGLVLAYLGAFSVSRVAGLSLLFSLILFPMLLRNRSGPVFGRARRGDLISLLVLLGLGAALFSRPVPYVFGGWDPGVYANTAAHLAREGTIFPIDRLAENLEPEEIRSLAWRHSRSYREKYPGFRYSSLKTGRLIPEFYHLFPVWMSVFYSWAGIKGLFCFTPLAGLAALAAVFFAVRELWGSRAALAGGILLVFNVVQIWQARFPTAEMFSQFLLFAGAAAVFKYLKREQAFWALTAAAAWGLYILTRISSILIWLPVAIFFYCRWWKKLRKPDLFFLVPLFLFTLVSFLPQIFGDWRYFANSLANLRLGGSILKLGPALAAGGIAAAVGLRLLPSRPRRRIVRELGRPFARRLLAAAVALAGVYGYFLRPFIGNPTADKTNLVEIGWLLGPLLLAAAFLGIILFLLKERSPSAWLFFLVIAAPAVVFIWRQMIHYYYMWAARRFADAVIPGLIVFAVYGLRRTARTGRKGRWLARAVFALLLAVSVYRSAPLFFHREYRGAAAFMRELAGELAGAGVVFVEGEFVDKIPTPLDLIYGLKVAPVYYGEAVLDPVFPRLAPREDRAAGRVYWLKDKSEPPRPGNGWDLVEKMVFHSPLWERRYDRLPRSADPSARDGNFTVYVFRAAAPSAGER